MKDHHIGRGFTVDPFVDSCGCGKAPCGLVDSTKINPDCPHHTPSKNDPVGAPC